jgi:hypothetical protein
MSHWRITLCDLQGRPLTSLTSIATQKSLNFKMNRPAQLSFRVPSDHPSVATIHEDGLPYIHPLARTVKLYRHEADERFHLRYTGYLWQVQDQGDTDTAWTSVTCYDAMMRLNKRFVRDSTGDPLKQTKFENTDKIQIAKTLVDRTNTASPTGISTSLGTFGTTNPTTHPTVIYEAPHRIGDALVELTRAMDGLELYFEPVDRTDGILSAMHAHPQIGQSRPNVRFGWGYAPHNVQSMTAMFDGETVANDFIGSGNPQMEEPIIVRHSNTPSINTFGRYEEIVQYPDLIIPDFIDALVMEELSLRSVPRELITIVPQHGRTFKPWDDFNLGDIIYVFAGERLRGGFGGAQRVYGFDLQIDDNAGERLTSVTAQPE